MEHSDSKQIYIIDDEEELTRLLKMRMEAAGYEAHTFNRPLEALAALEHTTPDLLIVDLMMPEMDGIELCKRIRDIPRFKTVPILMLTACYQQPERVRGFECGIDDFMNKPYDAKELMTRIGNLLNKRSVHQQQLESERLRILQETAVAVSHEVMTPLTALSLSLSNVKRYNTKADVDDDIDIMAQALSNIEALVYKLQRVTNVATEEYIDGISMINVDASV